MKKRRLTSLVLALALAGSGTFIASNVAQAAPPPATELTSAGQEFWLAFDIQLHETDTNYLRLYISGDSGTKGNVEITGLAFSNDFTIGNEGIASVDIPLAAMGSVDYTNAVPSAPGMIAPIAMHVTADHDVTVYGLNMEQYSTDAYLGLPVTALGQRYRLVDYDILVSSKVFGAYLSAVATQDNTTISVQPSAASEQAPFTATISRGEVFEWESLNGSLTGTLVTSDKPVSVFSGNRCTQVPNGVPACDHLVEQMMPTTMWGRTFVTYPLYGRTADTFRIVADVDGTQVTVNQASGAETHPLSAGEYWEFMSGEPMAISSNQPIEVAQYSNSEDFDNTISDPFMVLVPPYEQGFTDSTFATPTDGFDNYVNITAPTTSIADVKLDGAAIPANQWEAIPNSVYSGVSIPIDPGNHSITSVAPIQTIVYGFGDYDSYGYPGGLRTARIAEANVLTLGPQVMGLTGVELCVEATLADAHGNGIPGARVDITMTGVVTQNFSVVTGADGSVPVCATSTESGTAAVAAVQGDLSANSSLKWAKIYTVTFTDGQGKTISEGTVFEGNAATAPADPTRDGYKFDGWDKKFDNIQSDLTVNAKWTVEIQTGGSIANGSVHGNGYVVALACVSIIAGILIQRAGTRRLAKRR